MGTNTAAFSLFDALVLRPFPFEQAEELSTVALDLSARDGPSRAGLTAADLFDFRAEPGLFSGLAGWSAEERTVAGAGPAEVIEITSVTEGMFARVLRVQPTLGRTFLPEEHRPGSSASVLVSHSLWAGRLGADPAVLGRALSLGGEAHTIVGVMPEGFVAPFAPGARAWTASRPVVERCRGCPTLEAVGRLAPGTTLPVVHERAEAVLQRLGEAYPDTDSGARLVVEPLGVTRDGLRAAFAPLFLATGVALLIACANVAVLLVTRSRARRAELQLRAAVGAERGDLTTHLLLEAGVLALLGSAFAVLVSGWLIELFLATAAAAAPISLPVGLDRVAVGFNGVLGLGAVLLFGVAPSAFGTRRIGGIPSTRSADGSSRGPSARWASALLTGQVALATTLSAGAVIGVQALRDARGADLGFDPDGILAIEVVHPGGSLPSRESADALEAYLARLAEMPGIESVGAASGPPLAAPSTESYFRVGYEVGQPTTRNRAALRLVRGAYFYALGQGVVQGRSLREGDEAASPAPLVVNEAFAQAFLGRGRRQALDARIALAGDGEGWRQVVGVVEDVHLPGVASVPVIYAPHDVRAEGLVTVMLRTAGDPDFVAASARGILAGLDPDIAVRRSTPLSELVEAELGTERFAARLLAAFAGIALALSAGGLFAILTQLAWRRRAETGIRLALGAEPDDVGLLVTGPGLRLTLTGVLIGGAVSASLTGSLGGLVPAGFRIDPAAFLGAAALLLTVSWLAAWAPARRTARLDPASVLRDE
jgi:putative ABC transport system permease protein